MEQWSDQGIVLFARAHGEGGAVISLLTENHGRHAGYVHGAQSSKKRLVMEPGSSVEANWQAKTHDQLGSFQLELQKTIHPDLLGDGKKLKVMQSALALCEHGLPEREGHAGLFYGLQALFDLLLTDQWRAAYIMWEIQFLKELGFPLELKKCVGGGDSNRLTHISPKSGGAVSAEKAEPYRHKLLALPEFLKSPQMRADHSDEESDFHTGLVMTGYFLEHWAFNHHTNGVPIPRLMLNPKDL